MSQDIFIKMTGIEGESLDSAHKNEVDVLSWQWKVYQEANMHTGSGGGAGKATVQDLEFLHFIDKASPNLLKYCLTGKHIPEVVLTVRKAGGEPIEYLKITMSDVIVTMVAPYGQSDDDARIKETIRLSFAKVKQEYNVQNAQGGSAGAVTASYDIKGNKEA